MWQQIEINKRNSCILLTVMLFVLLLLGAAFGILITYYAYSSDIMGYINESIIINSSITGMVIAFAVWIILFFIAMTNGKNAILSMNKACKIPKDSHRILENVVEEMSIAAGLPKPPEIYVIDTPMPNAFATGLSPKNCAVAVTTGLLTELNRDELQGVIAHEIAHIVNRDTMYMIYAGIMIGTIVILSDFCLRYMRTRSFRSSKRSSGGKLELIILAVCIILMILAPILAKILYFSISQKREYLADACAIQYTRYPQGLASALTKIYSSLYMFRDADKITSAMFIVHPLDYEIRQKNNFSMFGNVFCTHPPTEKRIEILSKMAGADFNAYNEAFKKVSNRRTILKREFLHGVQPLDIVEPKKEETVFNPNIPMTAVTVATIASLSKTEQQNLEKISRKRDAEDIMIKANEYICKECSCGTKFKFPREYLNQDIKCPHCGQVIKVEE